MIKRLSPDSKNLSCKSLSCTLRSKVEKTLINSKTHNTDLEIISKGHEFMRKNVNDLLVKIRSLYNKIEFESKNTEYVHKEYCAELRRQLQLAKEIKIANLENQFEDYINRVDNYEKVLLEKGFEAEKMIKKINYIKKENKILNNDFNEHDYDKIHFENLKVSYSKLVLESEDLLNKIFNMNKLKFIEQYQTIPLGQLKVNALKTYDLRRHFEKFSRKINNLLDDLIVRYFSILDNGDLLVCFETHNYFRTKCSFALMIIDIKANQLIKKLYLNFHLNTIQSHGNLICVVYSDNNLKTFYNILILNRNLQKKEFNSNELNYFLDKTHNRAIVGLNDKLLYFKETCSKKTLYTARSRKTSVLKVYDLSYNLLKEIQLKRELKYLKSSFFSCNEKYFFISESKDNKVLKAVCEISSQLLWEMGADHFYMSNNNYYLYVINYCNDNSKTSFMIVSLNGEILRKKEYDLLYDWLYFNEDGSSYAYNPNNYKLYHFH